MSARGSYTTSHHKWYPMAKRDRRSQSFLKYQFFQIDTFLRRKFYNKNYVIPASTLGSSDIRFIQFNPATADYFTRKLKKTEIQIRDTPHYELARALASDQASLPQAEREYAEYLCTSWGLPEPNAKVAEKIASFKSLVQTIAQARAINRPVCLTKLGSETTYYALDGNHRLSVALALGLGVPVEEFDTGLAFQKFFATGAFYGAGHKGRPYQSILRDGKVLIKGRRIDLVERLHMIPRACIEGATVLDIGSNYGMSAIYAKKMGAARCLGLEYLAMPVNIATRFAMIEGLYPDVSFRKFDINSERLGEDEVFDTVFLFSVYKHIDNKVAIRRLLERNVGKYVIFEGHPSTDRHDYEELFEGGLFSGIEEIGRLPASESKPQRNRILWLCTRSGATAGS